MIGPGSRLVAPLLALAIACGEGRPESEPAEAMALDRARVALGAGFVGGRAVRLGPLFHPDLIVQPPEPDTAVGGAAAATYLETLARQTQVTGSQLVPTAMAQEGPFLLERGTWFLEAERPYRSRYTIRWRESGGAWQIVLWRWSRFR